MAEDFIRQDISNDVIEQHVLHSINDFLQSMGKTIDSYDLLEIIEESNLQSPEAREIYDEISIPVEVEHLNLHTTLNIDQMIAYNEIIDSVSNTRSQVFFVDGPRGTGKTYLYKAILAKVRSMGLIAIATATSGVAASIMLGGRTAHSRFKIPLTVDSDTICNIRKQSGLADLLRRATLIIWDEASMSKRQAFEALDRSLQDIMETILPFGGKIVVFGGDFRQVLPVVRRGTRAEIINSSLCKSHLWPLMRKLKLTRNIRAVADPDFAEYLLRIGEGNEQTVAEDMIRIPDDMVIKYEDDEASKNLLIEAIFPSIHQNGQCMEYITSRAILATRNDYVDALNLQLIKRFPEQEVLYHSFDSALDDTNNQYPPEV